MGEKGKLGFKETFSIAMGFAVGSGVITMTGVAIGMTGRSVIVSYVLTAVMFLLAVIPTLIMSSVYPTKSASYTYCKELLGVKIGGLYTYIYFLGRLTISIFGISCAQYIATIAPNVDQKLLAVCILSFFFIINLLGTKTVAKVQNVMFVVLIVSLFIFIVAGMMKVDIVKYFNPEGFYINGFEGVWQAASLLVFAVGGGGVLVDFADKIKNPGKTIPKVVILVTVVVTIAYAMLSLVAAGLLPYEEVAFKPLTVSAAKVFGQSSVLFFVFLLGGAILALTTTLNSSFLWYTSALTKSCEEGWMPRSWIKENRFGVPYRMTTIFYLFGLIPTILGLDIAVLSKMAVALTSLMWTIPVFALVRMPKLMPERWNNSKFAKMPKWLIWFLAILSFVIYVSQTVSLLIDNPPISNIIIGVYVVLVVVYLFAIKKKEVKVEKEEIVQ